MHLSAPAVSPQPQSDELMQAAAGFDKFFLHDKCSAQYPSLTPAFKIGFTSNHSPLAENLEWCTT